MFGPYHIEAMEQLKEPDYRRFEDFLSSLNSVFIKITAEIEALIGTEGQKAQNYEQLSFSFGQMQKFNHQKEKAIKEANLA